MFTVSAISNPMFGQPSKYSYNSETIFGPSGYSSNYKYINPDDYDTLTILSKVTVQIIVPLIIEVVVAMAMAIYKFKKSFYQLNSKCFNTTVNIAVAILYKQLCYSYISCFIAYI